MLYSDILYLHAKVYDDPRPQGGGRRKSLMLLSRFRTVYYGPNIEHQSEARSF